MIDARQTGAALPIMDGDRIGVEIGGTFTDMVWAGGDGTLHTGKTPSTPAAIEKAVLRVIDDAGRSLSQVIRVTHGSTVATNALITRNGAHVGLLTTRGFRDVLIVGRGDRDHDVYNVRYHRPRPAIERAMIREVPERIAADGSVLEPIDLDATWAEIAGFLDMKVDGIAISLLHAYRNPIHEKAIVELVRRRAPHVAVWASHEISPEFREYERTVTTVVSAFVGPVVESYVKRLDTGLHHRGYGGVLQIMQSNGGVMPSQSAGSNAVRMLLSGPAAGVRAAVWFARRNGLENVITLDMGGTSTDIAIAPGLEPAMVPELRVDGLPVRTTSVDMQTIGAGGGSLTEIDQGGFLKVGPQSAGAQPGPACYGRGGTRPTITDAQVIAGLLPPSRFFGGKMTLDIGAARASLETLALPGGVEATADSILRIANSNIAGAVRLVSTSKGVDPRDYTLVGFGGGGPLHSAMVAEELGLKTVMVPWAPGLASAFGLLIAETMIDVSESSLQPVSDATLDAETVARLIERSEQVAADNGVPADGRRVQIGLDIRYAGQAFELTVWCDPKVTAGQVLRDMFEAEHVARYGYKRSSLPVELISYRIRITRDSGGNVRTPLPTGTPVEPERYPITLAGKTYEAVSIPRDSLAAGRVLAGAAVLTEPTSTTFVPPGWQVECLASGDLLLRHVG